MQDWIGHVITSAIAFGAAVIAMYVSYRQLQQREWFRAEMTTIVKENCAGRIEFQAHVDADEVFKETIKDTIVEGNASKEELLKAKFEIVRGQVAAVGQRVDYLTTLVEKRSG